MPQPLLRAADQRPTTEVAKKHGISEQTGYAWRKRFGALEPVDVKRLRGLEAGNARLKKLRFGRPWCCSPSGCSTSRS